MTDETDLNQKPITREEFAVFVRVVQNAVNGVDSALQEAFEHVRQVQAASAARDQALEEGKQAIKALRELEKSVHSIRNELVNITSTLNEPNRNNVGLFAAFTAAVSAVVSGILSFIFKGM
jgi:hypothetical protein